MRRFGKVATAFGLSAVGVLVLLAWSAPASGGAVPAGSAVPGMHSAAPAPVEPGVGETLDLPAPAPAGGETCQADATTDTVSTLKPQFHGRTCRCSCGAPCKTDADCGGAVGSCRAGISCC